MKYVMLLMGHVGDPNCGAEGGPAVDDFFAFDAEITAAGIVDSSFALEDPEHAVAVTTDSAGEPVITNGPFAEVKEYVGGAYIIDVPSIDEAIAWAKKCPGSAPGIHVEIRPVAPY